MPDNEEMEQILESIMEDLCDRAGTGGKDDDDEEAGPYGDDQ